MAGEEKEKKEAAKEKPKKLFAWPFEPTERTDENPPNGVYGAVAKCRRGEKFRDSVGGHCKEIETCSRKERNRIMRAGKRLSQDCECKFWEEGFKKDQGSAEGTRPRCFSRM